MKIHKLGTRIAEIILIIFSVVSLVLFFSFMFSNWSEKFRYEQNRKLPLVGEIEEAPYDYWPLMRYCIVVFILCLIGIVICEISANLYEIGKSMNNQRSPFLAVNNQVPIQQPQAIMSQPIAPQPAPTTSYNCPKCGKLNKIQNRFCEACGTTNPNLKK